MPTGRVISFSGMGSQSIGENLPPNSSINATGMGQLIVRGDVGEYSIIACSGRGRYIFQGKIGEGTRINFSGMGVLIFDQPLPLSVANNIRQSGMGSLRYTVAKSSYSSSYEDKKTKKHGKETHKHKHKTKYISSSESSSSSDSSDEVYENLQSNNNSFSSEANDVINAITFDNYGICVTLGPDARVDRMQNGSYVINNERINILYTDNTIDISKAGVVKKYLGTKVGYVNGQLAIDNQVIRPDAFEPRLVLPSANNTQQTPVVSNTTTTASNNNSVSSTGSQPQYTLTQEGDCLLKVSMDGITTTYAGDKFHIRDGKKFLDNVEVLANDPRILYTENTINQVDAMQIDNHNNITSTSNPTIVTPVSMFKPVVKEDNKNLIKIDLDLSKFEETTQTYIKNFNGKIKNNSLLAGIKLTKEEKAELMPFMDPISFELPNIPVKLRETLYDLETLLKLPKQEDPQTRIPFSWYIVGSARVENNKIQEIINRIKANHECKQEESLPKLK